MFTLFNYIPRKQTPSIIQCLSGSREQFNTRLIQQILQILSSKSMDEVCPKKRKPLSGIELRVANIWFNNTHAQKCIISDLSGQPVTCIKMHLIFRRRRLPPRSRVKDFYVVEAYADQSKISMQPALTGTKSLGSASRSQVTRSKNMIARRGRVHRKKVLQTRRLYNGNSGVVTIVLAFETSSSEICSSGAEIAVKFETLSLSSPTRDIKHGLCEVLSSDLMDLYGPMPPSDPNSQSPHSTWCAPGNKCC